MRILLALLTVAGMFWVSTPARATGRVLYVSPDGDDFLPNSKETPWETIHWAVRRALPGDTILVRAGTYEEAVGWGATPGTPSQPIRLENYQNERVIIQGTLQLVGADYWTVDGIDVTHDPAQGRREALVKFDGGVGWRFLNSKVWGTRGVSNVMISGNSGTPRNYLVAGNCIYDNKATGDPFMNDHNIYLTPGYGSGPGVIERNILFNAPNGANIKAAGPNSATGAADVVIRFNTMANAGAGVIVGYGSHHVDVRGNLFGPQDGGGQLYQAAVVGNTVSGTANSAFDNAVFGYQKTVWSTNDSSRPVSESRSIRVNPHFDKMTCSGFKPGDNAASAYGRYGDGDYPSTGSDTFRDDDGSVFETDIEKVAATGITRGCNPPVNDHFCPEDPVTRGQMAAFLTRGLNLASVGVDHFDDDNHSSFEADINSLASSGVTKGCNPPHNTEYCPDLAVTRGQMAAFLTRAFGYSSGSKDYFDDDNNSTFEADIDSLASSRVTKGCNPPSNDRFCPNALVTRGEMAAFLVRALDL